MSKQKELYVQCELDHGQGSWEVAWIQEKLAVVGQTIKLKDYDYPVKINKAYIGIKKTLSEIDINRNNPLRERTDI